VNQRSYDKAVVDESCDAKYEANEILD